MTKDETSMFASLHKQWLQQPMTRALLAGLDKHESHVCGVIGRSAMDTGVTSEHVRLLAAQLATVQTIKKLIHDTDTFTAKCSSGE